MYTEKFDAESVKVKSKENLDAFSIANALGGIEFYLEAVKSVLESQVESIKTIKLDGKEAQTFEHFKDFEQKLSELFTKEKIIDKNRLFGLTGVTKEKVVEDFSKEKTITLQGVMSYSKEIMGTVEEGDIEEQLILGGQLVHQVSNTLKMAQDVIDYLPKIENPTVKRFNLFYLYVMVFECNLKFLKFIYQRTGVRESMKVKQILTTLSTQFGFLTTYMNDDLRNDVSHVGFEYRANFSNETLLTYVQNLYLEIVAFTYVINKNYVSVFDGVSGQIEEFKKKHPDAPSPLNDFLQSLGLQN